MLNTFVKITESVQWGSNNLQCLFIWIFLAVSCLCYIYTSDGSYVMAFVTYILMYIGAYLFRDCHRFVYWHLHASLALCHVSRSLQQRGQCICFLSCFTPPHPPPPPATRQCLAHTCHLSILTNTDAPVRASIIIWWERFRGTQKEDDFGPLGIQFYLLAEYGGGGGMYFGQSWR